MQGLNFDGFKKTIIITFIIFIIIAFILGAFIF